MSESFSALSAELERTLSRLRTYFDDQGRGIDNPRLIKAAIYPLHDEQTPEVIDTELDELARLKMVIRWEQDGKRYICERPEAWAEQQHPQKPTASKCPTPPGYIAVEYRATRDSDAHSSGAVLASYGTTTRALHDNYANPPEDISDDSNSAREFPHEVGVGEGVGVGNTQAPDPATPSRRRELLDALSSSCGWQLDRLTKREREKAVLAAAELDAVGATADEVKVRASNYRRHYPDSTITPMAISGNWQAIEHAPKRPKDAADSGARFTTPENPCPECSGNGKILNSAGAAERCAACDGTGETK